MRYLSLLILFLPFCILGQDAKYRLQTSFGFHSTMYGGTRSFENVTRTDDYSFKYYEDEYYDIDYKNMSFSAGFNLKLSLNWINKKNYVLRQSTSIFADIYEEKISYTLRNFNVGDTSWFPNHTFQHEFNVGQEGIASLNGIGFGAIHELVYLQKFDNGWCMGGGLSYNWMRRDDRSFQHPSDFKNYAPNYTRYTWGTYTTKQLGVVFNLEKIYNQWSVYLNLNQAVITTKSYENKGGDYFQGDEKVNPISHNLDFRYPLMIQFGAAFQFKKLKH